MSLTEKLRMNEFLEDRLEASGRYRIMDGDPHYLLVEGDDILTEGERKPGTVYILTHRETSSGQGKTVDQVKEIQRRNRAEGIATAHIFYMDDKYFFKHLSDAEFSGKRERSLKNYPDERIREMIHLRDLEKLALEHSPDSEVLQSNLTYYNPEREGEEESLKVYRMWPVRLDYSHLPETVRQSRGLGRTHESDDYRLPEEIIRIPETQRALLTITDEERGLANVG